MKSVNATARSVSARLRNANEKILDLHKAVLKKEAAIKNLNRAVLKKEAEVNRIFFRRQHYTDLYEKIVKRYGHA